MSLTHLKEHIYIYIFIIILFIYIYIHVYIPWKSNHKLFKGWFPNHHYFSRGLLSSNRDHHFKMVVDFQVQGMTHGNCKGNITHSIYVSCIYLHFVDVYGKCR